MLTLSYHAKVQCEERGFDPTSIEQRVAQKHSQIARFSRHETRVLVVVAKLSREVHLPDGSNGDQIVAAVDPRDLNTDRPAIVTVFVNRQAQSYSTNYKIIR